MSITRAAFAAVSWLFVGMVALQVFFAGLGLFGTGGMGLHIDFGYLIPFAALVVFVAALAARPGGRTGWLAGALLVITGIQTMLPWFRGDVPAIAALHPVNALLIFWTGLILARRAAALVRAMPAAEADEVSAVRTA